MKKLIEFLTGFVKGSKHSRLFPRKLFANNKSKSAFLIYLTMVLMGCSTTTFIDFSNLSSVSPPGSPTPVSVGDKFYVGDVLIENNTHVKLIVLPFNHSSNTSILPCPPGWTQDGYIEIVQDNMAGGSGPELHFSNACLGIIPPSAKNLRDIKFKFGEYGGNINFILNGALLNYDNFKDIPPQSNVNLVVSPSLPLGMLELSGQINSFWFSFPCPVSFPPMEFSAVVGGGQELWVDNIEFTLSP